MIAVTIDTLPGYDIIEVFGEVLGVTARPQNTFLAGVRSLSGAPGRGERETLANWRREAVAHMLTLARRHGANAVVGMRFDHRPLGSAWSEICAYGTAVLAAPRRA